MINDEEEGYLSEAPPSYQYDPPSTFVPPLSISGLNTPDKYAQQLPMTYSDFAPSPASSSTHHVWPSPSPTTPSMLFLVGSLYLSVLLIALRQLLCAVHGHCHDLRAHEAVPRVHPLPSQHSGFTLRGSLYIYITHSHELDSRQGPHSFTHSHLPSLNLLLLGSHLCV